MNPENIPFDEALLLQYLDILGYEGLELSFKTFKEMAPRYYLELQHAQKIKDETEIRRVAHKLKGSCSTLGLNRLAQALQSVERDAWSCTELSSLLQELEQQIQADVARCEAWLERQKPECKPT